MGTSDPGMRHLYRPGIDRLTLMIEAAIHEESQPPILSSEMPQGKKFKSEKITPAIISKVDKKKTNIKVTKKYDQVWTIKPRELRRLLYVKSILMGPPDAKGMISILDRLNIAIKGKEVTHAMFSSLLDDWNRALRTLSDLDSELAQREPLPGRERFDVGVDRGQYNWGNLVATEEYFEDWESDF